MIRTFIPESDGPEIEPPNGSPGLWGILAVLGATVCVSVVFYLLARYSGLSVVLK